MTKSLSPSHGLLILLQVSGRNPGLIVRCHALPIHQHLSLESRPFVFKLLGHAPTVGQAFHLLQLRLVETTLHSLASPIIQVIVIDTIVQETCTSCHHVHASQLDALGTLDSERPSPLVLAQQLGGADEIAWSKPVWLSGHSGFEEPSPDHLHVVMVHVGCCHVDAGMNMLVVAGQQLG